MASSPFLGEVRMFAGTFAPRGWAFCSGQLMAISQYDAVYALLGTTYGGDGITTFALPDMRSRRPVHWGQGPGLSNYVLGQAAGVETVTLNQQQMPTHSHPATGGGGQYTLEFPCSTNAGSSNSPGGRINAVSPTGSERFAPPNSDGLGTTAALNAALTPTLGVAGGSQPHENLPPLLAVSFIICLEGIFPSRN